MARSRTTPAVPIRTNALQAFSPTEPEHKIFRRHALDGRARISNISNYPASLAPRAIFVFLANEDP
jgi:hypothetical protein